MSRKIALLIGVGDYGAGLKPLHCPINGVEAMRSVLNAPAIGGFDEVNALINPGVGEMRSRICEVFARAHRQDLVLFYFTGHGIKDMTGDFYLTTTQSQLFENGRPNAGTSVEAQFLKREISNSAAERKVVILDCCFGAAFADGFLAMNDSSIDVETQLGGKGWCVLTASTSARYALEKKGEPLSVYTHYLVEGLKTGGAAPDGQDVISARHLHEYIKAKVQVAAPAMEPAIFNRQQGYDIIIAKVQIDNEQRYRKQVQAKHHNGIIGPAARATLAQWQQLLGLSPQQVQTIEAEILHPYHEKQKHLAVYAAALQAEKNRTYPLEKRAIQDLKDLQRLLSLRDEDVQAVEQQTLGNKINADEQRPNIQVSVWQGREKPPPTSGQYANFRFETVKVNRKGEAIKEMLAEATTFTEDLGNGVALEMVRIPGGTFMMGAMAGEEGARAEEMPQKEVTVADFWMGKYVITQAQWHAAALPKQDTAPPNPIRQPVSIQQASGQRVTGQQTDSPHKQTTQQQTTQQRTTQQQTIYLKESNHPVENIFWADAVEFCQWLSQRTGRSYQLPSGAQWEYACRAGTTTPFYFGETITPEVVNYNGNYTYGQGPRGKYRQQTTEVGSFPPNLFGLYDMHGNVWEWCLDGWHDLHTEVSENPSKTGSAWRLSGQKKFLKGGSWSYLPTNCRSAYQLNYPFHSRIDDIGFRVVCLSMG